MKKVISSIIIITIVGIIGIIVWNPFHTDGELVETKELDINSDLIKKLYQIVTPSEDATVLTPLYEKDNFSNEYIISVGISNLLRNMNGERPELLSKLEIERSIHDVFGDDINFSHESTMLLISGVCAYDYQQSTEQYVLVSGCGGNSHERFYRKVMKAIQKNNVIELIEKSIYMNVDWDDYLSRVYIYNNYNKEKVLDYYEKPSSENVNINLDDYIEQASTYIYTFKLQNGKYILESMRKKD